MKCTLGFAALILVGCSGPSKTAEPTRPPVESAVIAPTAPPAPTASGPVVPDTPAGKVLLAWLDVFNSGDDASMKAFAEQYKAPPQSVEVGFRAKTGGFSLVGVENSKARSVRLS